MTEHWLDRAARGKAEGAASRRSLARLGVGGALAALGLPPEAAAAAACRAPKKPCDNGGQCCTKWCKRDKCVPCPNGARFVPAPDLLCWLASGTAGSGNGQFNDPRGVAVGANGPVYVADTHNHRIQQFTATGNFVRTWGSPGSGAGKFSGLRGVAVGGNGQVYVADEGNHRIVRVLPL